MYSVYSVIVSSDHLGYHDIIPYTVHTRYSLVTQRMTGERLYQQPWLMSFWRRCWPRWRPAVARRREISPTSPSPHPLLQIVARHAWHRPLCQCRQQPLIVDDL